VTSWLSRFLPFSSATWGTAPPFNVSVSPILVVVVPSKPCREHRVGQGISAIHFDGVHVWTGGADGLVNLRSAATLEVLANLTLKDASPSASSRELRISYKITSLFTTPKFVFAGTDSGIIETWERGTLQRQRDPLRLPVWDYIVNICGNDKYLFGAHYEEASELAIWDLSLHAMKWREQGLVNVIPTKRLNVRCVAATSDLLFVGIGSAINVYSLPQCTLLHRLKRHRFDINSLALTSTRLISVDQRRNLIMWDKNLRVVHEVENGEFCTGRVPLVANESLVVAESGDHSIVLLSPTKLGERRTLSAKNGRINALGISDRYLLAGGFESLEAWDLNSFEKVREIETQKWPGY
jgi:hypothetical protein